jgi:hypothetical protein
MHICLVLGAGASLANAQYFRPQRQQDTHPPLDTTFLLEHEEGRPLISALVVRKSDSSPGPGFWDFAQKLGLDPGSTADARLKFWIREVERCYAHWSGPARNA